MNITQSLNLKKLKLHLMRFWIAFRSTPILFRIGASIILLLLFISVTASLWAPYSATQLGDLPFQGSSKSHIFGTDYLGRDVFSRVVIGTRLELLLATFGTLTGTVIGLSVGLTAAYMGGWIDEVSMRIADALISVPFLILGLLIVTSAGPDHVGSPLLLIAVMAVIYAPRMARVARASALEIVTRDFVTIARLRGDHAGRIIWKEILPNARNPLLVEFAIRLGNAPVVIGSLGFLGFGVQPPMPEWGLMISENTSAILTAPVTVLAPALFLAVLVVGVNTLSEGYARWAGGVSNVKRKK